MGGGDTPKSLKLKLGFFVSFSFSQNICFLWAKRGCGGQKRGKMVAFYCTLKQSLHFLYSLGGSSGSMGGEVFKFNLLV